MVGNKPVSFHRSATTLIIKRLKFPFSPFFSFIFSSLSQRLFDYIDGNNKDEVKVPMTAPVLADVEPSCGPFCKQTFTISFFVPFHLHEAPPAPNNPDITITCTPAFTAYVSEAGGFKLDDYSLGLMASALSDALSADGIEYVDDHWFVAGYDPPFRIKDRHTEIWFKAKEDKESSSAVAQE